MTVRLCKRMATKIIGNCSVDAAFARVASHVCDACAVDLLTAMFDVLTESQKLRVLAQYGWETMPKKVPKAPKSR